MSEWYKDFKVGDKVKIVFPGLSQTGLIAKVKEVKRARELVLLKFDIDGHEGLWNLYSDIETLRLIDDLEIEEWS